MNKKRFQQAFQIVAVIAAWIGAPLLGAGRVDWARGWIYIGLNLVGMTAATLVVRRYNPSLLAARANWRHQNTKAFDKLFLALFMPLVFVQPAVAGIDAVRYGWSSLSSAWAYAGVILFVSAIILLSWVLAVNPFAETTVRIQAERGHTVIASGPYGFVRHPMYVGAMLMYLAIPLILGSVWALAVGGLIAALLVWRTALEDWTLRAELPGYVEYAARTRYRLVPKCW